MFAGEDICRSQGHLDPGRRVFRPYLAHPGWGYLVAQVI
jgi:hypothetical protein